MLACSAKYIHTVLSLLRPDNCLTKFAMKIQLVCTALHALSLSHKSKQERERENSLRPRCTGAENQSLPSAKNTIFRIWYQNVQKNVLCLVPESTMLCFARIILQRAKCAITLYTDHAWVARCRLYHVHWSLSWLAARAI